ncbi:hypothetical protein D3C84_1220060 [compost metagenome]
MRANGAQLNEIMALIGAGTIKPVVDRSFLFELIYDALSDVETGRTKGKVVVGVIQSCAI